MSCLCPIRIPDVVARERGYKGATMVVPCGHCVECARARRNDWFVRIWSTYQRYAALGLPTWFVTITIDPRLWPNMNLKNPDIGNLISPFVRSWNERLRYLNGGFMPLRFLSSEFGSCDLDYIDYKGRVRVTTGALHFHGVLFGKLPIKRLKEGFAQTHGHVDFDLVRGPEGIRYVVKYSTKDYSIDDPRLRARTFCSPGIGDSSYYFGDGAPTFEVLINGFHYRTPRYFLDKQWCRIYGRGSYFDSRGRSLRVEWNFKRRLVVYERQCRLFDSLTFGDSAVRSYCLRVLDSLFSEPASLSVVKALCALRQTGPSHPLLRREFRDQTRLAYISAMSSDDSFNDLSLVKEFYLNNYYNQFYERNPIVFPLSFDFSS